MSRRREPTQRERVARALSYFGRTSALDWHDATIDNRPPIWNLPARIDELRRAGWLIDSQDRDRNRLAIYRLVRPCAPDASSPVPGEEHLFEATVGAPTPLSPYDARAEA